MTIKFNHIEMKFIYTWLLGLFVLISPVSGNSQDIHYSNVPLSNSTYSIGSIGSDRAYIRATSLYRNQWPTVGKAYTTYGITAEGKIDLENKNSLGIGFVSNRDQAGDLSLTKLQAEVAVVYSQRVSRKSYLSGGIQGGFIQHSIDGTDAQWQNQFNGKEFDPSLPSQEDPLFQPFMNYTMGAGIRWKFDNNQVYSQGGVMSNLQVGLSMYHAASSSLNYLSTETENIRVVFSGSSSIGLDFNQSLIEPSFVYQQKGKENELVLGGMYKYVIRQGTRYTSFTERIDLSAGAFLRLPNDAIIPTFNFTYGNFAVGIAYDINISPLIQASNSVGGVEFCLQFCW